MREAWIGFRDAWRIMWELGGPFAVFIYRLDGSLAERVAKIRAAGPEGEADA